VEQPEDKRLEDKLQVENKQAKNDRFNYFKDIFRFLVLLFTLKIKNEGNYKHRSWPGGHSDI
jgi:hypothetical protein